MAKYQATWKSALTPQKAPTYGNQAMLIASPKELQISNVDYVVVFEGTKKYHVAIADVVNPYTLQVVIPEHDIAEEVLVKVYICQDSNLNVLTHLKFTYISQMEHAIAKFLAQSASDTEVAEKLDAVWTVCLGKDHLELWDKRLAQAFAQLELPIEWTLVGDILQNETESHETLLHFAARNGLKELINVFLDLPGAKRALSTCNKSGLLPRDVARECGRLDLVELLDADRSSEQRKSGTFKDSSRRKVRRNNDNGLTTITNLRNHNVQEDIKILIELSKLRAKRISPINRRSWPEKIQSFHSDGYIEDLEKELNKVLGYGESDDAKRSFIDENLIRLRDIREEICNLRSRNAEETSKDISFIADQNRRPAHSRRLSAPASVERRKRPGQGLPNLQSRPDSSASERSQGNQGELANKIPPSTEVFSTPPLSPPVGQLIDLDSATVTSPVVDDTFPLFDDVPEFLTPSSNTPSSSPLPQSPIPISLKYSDVEKRSQGARKSRPQTWYGGSAAVAPGEEDEPFPRSNSLEDFAKALEEVSDDESDANSKENLLQTMSSLTKKASRTESFVSSMSDLSVEKESVESDVECEHGDDSGQGDDEGTQEGIEDDTNENVKDIEDHEKIKEEPEEQKDDEEYKETGSANEIGDVEGHSGDRDNEQQPDVVGQEEIESESHDKVEKEELLDLNQTAGSDENIENCRQDLEHTCNGNDTEDLKSDNDTNKHALIEENEDLGVATSSNREEDDFLEEEKQEDRQDEAISEHENTGGQAREGGHQDCSEQQVTNELETVVCNGVEVEVEVDKDTKRDVHYQDEELCNETGDEKGSKDKLNDDLVEQDEPLNDNEELKVNEEAQDSEEPSLNPEENNFRDIHADPEASYADPEASEITEDHMDDKGIEDNLNEDFTMVSSNEEPNLIQSSTEDPVVEDNVSIQLDIDQPERNEDPQEENVDSLGGSEDTPRANEDASKETERKPNDSEDRAEETQDRPENSGDFPAECRDLSAEFDDSQEESGKQPKDLEAGTDDTEENDDNSSVCQTKIQFQDIKDMECEVQDFCLPGENVEPNKELFRIQATDDVESEEDSDQSKHIRFDEKTRSLSPLTSEERSPKNDSEDTFSGGMFRHRSAVLLGVKTPVKRTGSDVSVTSLQDVQLNIHTVNRGEDIISGMLNISRKAKSFGDLSTLAGGRSEMVKDDEDMTEDERRRIQEDQAQLSVLSRVKKIENASKYASNERLEQISNSRVTMEREDEDQSRRRWSNLFSSKNPKPTKKPGRTPTFRRDTLRSSMGSKSSKNAGKNTIESLVMGQHATAFAKHSQTAPNLQVSATRPRSQTRDSPSSIRKSPTVSSIDSEEQKPDSPEEAEIPNEDLDLDVDSDLEKFEQEPEAWSVTVERKMLKKMNKNEIKRQDVILELIQTEGHHVRTLKIMQQVFYRGLNKVANYAADRLDELFPRINDLVEISARFYRNLRCRQDEGAVVQKIGDVIVRQFTGDSGEQLRQAYGEFVSKHPEAVALYKHHFKTDKKFSNFIKKCHGHRIVRRLSVPECFTLVTQRMTKYPLLIEAVLKVTKSSNADHKELQKALLVVKDATKSIDNAIKDYEKQSRLKDIKMRTEKGSAVLKTGQKIKNSRFVEYQSKMIHDGILQWRSARGKLAETHVVLLEAMVVFLQENDKKFSLLAIDGKSPCIALKTLMVREVATDKCAIYFVSTSKKGPEMYEFVCSSQKEKKQWYSIITDAIAKAPEETDDLFQSPEEEKRLAEERLKRRNEILEIMKEKDKGLSDLVSEKNKLVTEMKELWQMPDGYSKKEDERIASNEKAWSILLEAIHRTTQLTADTVLHESHSDSELAAATYDKKASSPKRAETFGGFDRRPSQKGSRRATTTIPEGKPEENHASLRRDSGLSLASESVVGLNTLSQGQEVAGSRSFQTLEALQWVLVQFSKQETALETLRVELQSTTEEMKKLRSLKIENDKKHFLMKEEHQAELTRQKKAYSDLERTFNEQVSELKLKLSSQQEQQTVLLQNFSELRRALTQNK